MSILKNGGWNCCLLVYIIYMFYHFIGVIWSHVHPMQLGDVFLWTLKLAFVERACTVWWAICKKFFEIEHWLWKLLFTLIIINVTKIIECVVNGHHESRGCLFIEEFSFHTWVLLFNLFLVSESVWYAFSCLVIHRNPVQTVYTSWIRFILGNFSLWFDFLWQQIR